jgi:hypothetical protein
VFSGSFIVYNIGGGGGGRIWDFIWPAVPGG